jgi:hypothetical protein
MNATVIPLQGCPFCRKVREAINILDLDVLMYPTPAVPYILPRLYRIKDIRPADSTR